VEYFLKRVANFGTKGTDIDTNDTRTDASTREANACDYFFATLLK